MEAVNPPIPPRYIFFGGEVEWPRAEIGYQLDKKKAKKSVFIIDKIKKYRKCPALADPTDAL